MPAESEDASSRPSDVAEKQLKDRSRANDLRTFRLLRPTQRIANCSCLFRARCRAKRLRNFQEPLARNPAKPFNQLRRVSRIMPLQNLVYTSWMAERGVALAIPEVGGGSSALLPVTGMRSGAPGRHSAALDASPVKPSAFVVTAILSVPAGEDASQIFSILELLCENDRSVGVVDHILAKIFFVFENVMNEPAEKQDVRSGAQGSPNVCHCGGAAETRIDVNDLRTALSRFDHPLETDRVILRHIRAHNQNGIRIHEIARRSCRSASTEGSAQTGHR